MIPIDAASCALNPSMIAAKKAKNYALADAIRADLLAQGITLIDTKEGTTFKKN